MTMPNTLGDRTAIRSALVQLFRAHNPHTIELGGLRLCCGRTGWCLHGGGVRVGIPSDAVRAVVAGYLQRTFGISWLDERWLSDFAQQFVRRWRRSPRAAA